MPWKYFFDQDIVIHSGVEISAYETNRIENNVKRVIEVTHGRYLLEAIGYLFQMSFTDIFEMCKKSNTFMKMLTHLFDNTWKNSLICKIMFQPVYSTTKISSCVHGHIAIIVIDNLEITAEEAKNVIASILDGGRIHDLISSAKCNLIFDYQPVDIDSIESCFAEIHQRNDISTIIPLYSYNNAPESFNVPTIEKNSIACHLTKLLIITSKILTEYSGSSNYLEGVDKNYNQDIVLLGKINTRCSDFINRLRNKAVHKMKNEINIFMYLLIQLEKLLREKEVTPNGWNREYEDCMKNLKSLYHCNLIPKSDAWIQIQDSCLLLSENCENWKYRVIWPLGEQLPPYYDMEELSTYSWILDCTTEEKEPRLIINREKYYFGMAEIEENGWKNTFSRSNIKNILKYAFRDKDELCKSITCPCSPAKKRLWLCERCLWLVRMHGPTGVFCRCRKTTMEKMKVYCNGCKTDKIAREMKPNSTESPLPLLPSLPLEPQNFTVIFLGESGVGKSTLISGLGNYLNWPTFEEAKKNQMQVCIPLQFKVQRRGVDKKIIETIVTAGDPEDNKNFNDTGQSVTQQPKVHQFTFQENTVKFIDTSGLSDSRGAEQDKKNLELIRECIHDQKEIHAICIVLKSNDTRLRPEFELALRDLLSLFPKPALKNVFFFFTYASRTFFGIGDSTGPVKEMQKKIQDSHEETYSFEGENTCVIDSESFKFLLCEERGVKYSNRPEEDFDFCWNESAAQVSNFLNFIKTVKPIEKKTTLAVHHLVTTALRLEEFIRTSDQLIQRKRDHLVNESKIIMFMAKKYSMVTEYHRLITDVTDCSIEEFCESCDQCGNIVKPVDRRLSEDISKHVKETSYLLQSHNEAEKFNHEDKHGISPPRIEEVVNNSKQSPIANTDQHNPEEDISSFEIINNDEDKKVPIETSSTENDKIGQISKENGIPASSLPIPTKSPPVEKPKMSPPPVEVTPEWDKIITVYQEHETISLPKKFTIIFLGESGVGKSTLISGLGNYLNWPTFEEAKKNQMQVCIPLQFKVQRKGEDNKIAETLITVGDPEDNENFNDIGQSVTQKPKVHEFTFQSNKIKVIDTPGLSEYGNSDLDKEKLNLIRSCVHEQENIHAICIALKSDGSTLNNHYIVTLRWLLSIFPKIALSNVFFFFTHADRTRFETEASLELLQEVQQRLKDIYGEIFKLQSWNTYSVDSESFKYFLSKEQGVKYSNRAEKYFAYCWEETSSQIRKFLNCITTIRPINKEVIVNVHKLKASDSQLRIQETIETEDEPVISKGMDKLQFMIMKHSLVTPRYSPMSEDVKMEELFTDLDEMAPLIEKYIPGVLERIPEMKEVIHYFENLQ